MITLIRMRSKRVPIFLVNSEENVESVLVNQKYADTHTHTLTHNKPLHTNSLITAVAIGAPPSCANP